MLVKANDDPDSVLDPKTIGELALSIQRLERAALLSIEKEKQIRKAYAEEAAEQVDQAATQIGLTVEGAELIKQKILGIA